MPDAFAYPQLPIAAKCAKHNGSIQPRQFGLDAYVHAGRESQQGLPSPCQDDADEGKQ